MFNVYNFDALSILSDLMDISLYDSRLVICNYIASFIASNNSETYYHSELNRSVVCKQYKKNSLHKL